MDEHLHRKLKIQAATESNTINDVVVEAVVMYLQDKCKNIQDGNNTQCTQTIQNRQLTINQIELIIIRCNL